MTAWPYPVASVEQQRRHADDAGAAADYAGNGRHYHQHHHHHHHHHHHRHRHRHHHE